MSDSNVDIGSCGNPSMFFEERDVIRSLVNVPRGLD